MVPFEYRRIGQAFYEQLAELVHSGQSSVILAPRYGGKRHVMDRVERLLRERHVEPLVMRMLGDEPVRTTGRLAAVINRAVRDARGVVPATVQEQPLAVLDALAREAGQPVVLLVANVDAMAHHVARTFLEGVRTAVEARRLIVVLTGEHDFRDLVHGPKSEFNCANQFFLNGYEPAAFTRAAQEFADALSLEFEAPDAAHQVLFTLTGGNTYLLRMVLAAAIEGWTRKRQPDPHGSSLVSIAELQELRRPDSLPLTYWAHLMRHAVQLIAWEPECWPDLERLLARDPQVQRLPAGSPGPLEFSGLIVREHGALRFASPLMESFARRYYTLRRFGDLYARKGDWSEAFKRYDQCVPDERIRPSDTDDRVEVEAVVRALGATMHSGGGDIRKLKQLLGSGARNVLGFEEVTFWHFDRQWRLFESHWTLSSAVTTEIATALPVTQDVPPGWFPLREPLGRFAVAAILKGMQADKRCAVIISNFQSKLVISRERERLGRDLVQQFADAYGHAIDVSANRQRLRTRNQHLEILNAILEALGSQVLDVGNVLVLAARGLRLAYKRVLFCLVDYQQQQIVGAHLDSDDGVDLAEMTKFDLDKPLSDIQPYVIYTRQPKIVPDAEKEPLTNKKAVRAARHGAFAIVPMLSRTDEAIGTIHIEREDGATPSPEEVEDLMLFGRQLAIVIAQSERVNLQQKALDKIPEPLLIVDQLQRIRYGNKPAADLFDVPLGWREKPETLSADGPRAALQPYLEEAVRGARTVHLITEGIGSKPNYRGTIIADGVDDWRGRIVGGVIHIQDQNFLHRTFEAVALVGAAHDTDSALGSMLEAAKMQGYDRARLYLIPADDRTRLVSARSNGLAPDRELAFNAGQMELPRRGDCPTSWLAIERQEPVIFHYDPDGINGTIVSTTLELPAVVVAQPPLRDQLEKEPGDFWIDVPLMTLHGAIGKFTLQCQADIAHEEFEMLKVLGHQAGQLLLAFRERDRQIHERERWVEAGLETSMSSIAHNVATRLGALSVVLTRYRLREGVCSMLEPLNDQFDHVLHNTLTTIRRTKELLTTVVAESLPFELDTTVRRALSENMKPEDAWDVSSAERPFGVVADRHLIESALVELIQNSRQIVPEDECLRVLVSIRAVEHNGAPWVIVEYRDNGPGVPPEIKKRIFEPFFSQRPGKTTGTGLGLAFVRRVVKAHGGDVDECGTFGAGAVFELTFPRGEAAEGERAAS